MSPRPLLLPLALSLALLSSACATPPAASGPSTPPAAAATAPAADKAAQLDRLYAEYWEEVLKMNPIQATFQGDARYNDRMPDFYSKAFRDESRAFTRRWLERVEAIGPEGLSGQDLISYEIFVNEAKDSLFAEKFPGWMLPVNQMGSIVTYAAMLGSGSGAQPFKTVKDYENWLARGNRLPVVFDTMIANMREGMKAGVVQPRALMVKVGPQIDAILKPKAEDTLFWGPIKSMPADFSAADKARLLGTEGGTSLVELTLHSGRNRIVRRMMAEVGHPVVDLVRRQFGPLHLGTLPAGRARELTTVERGALLTIARRSTPDPEHD